MPIYRRFEIYCWTAAQALNKVSGVVGHFLLEINIKNLTRFIVAYLASLFFVLHTTQSAPESEPAPNSKLTGIVFNCDPVRDLRPASIANASDFLTREIRQNQPAATVSDIEVIVWANVTDPVKINGFQTFASLDLRRQGYNYSAGNPVAVGPGQTITMFLANSQQKGQLIGYWQTAPQGFFLAWGRVVAAPAPAAQPAADAKDDEIAQLKRRLAELEAAKKGQAPANGSNPTAAPAQAADNAPLVSIEQSEIVAKDSTGSLVVASKDGRGIDGVKLSQHDIFVGTPCIAVAPDGSIHVAFVEKHRTTQAAAVYHRSSSDNGKTWTDAKNLTEDMPGIDVGRCQVLADRQNRVYIIWRAALSERWMGTMSCDPIACRSNLFFRVLEGGKWTTGKPVGELCPDDRQQDAARSFFAAVDGAGRAQVVWNVLPDKWHPDFLYLNMHSNGVGNGLVFQATLDGATAGAPREVYLPVSGAVNARMGPSCDDLDSINGYVDAGGAAHFVATTTGLPYGANPHKPEYQLFENGRPGKIVRLPDLAFHAGKDVPTLLVDAAGKPHMIAMFLGGERPGIRDYSLASDEEPTTIRALGSATGAMIGFQASQGPAGRMVAIMQMNDTGQRGAGDNYISVSTGGGKWSPPVNVTNNAGRKSYVARDTTVASQVTRETGADPGACAAAFDHQGHLLLLHINNEFAIVHSTVVGLNVAGGGHSVPTLRFLKF